MNKKETICGNVSEALRNPYYAYRHRYVSCKQKTQQHDFECKKNFDLLSI